ncbi:MAG: lipid-binding SYLF domain-containing protein [Verrucomicrobiota bacterium]
MYSKTQTLTLALAATVALIPSCTNPITRANAAHASASRISHDSQIALASLYAKKPKAKELAGRAKSVLIFPSIVKGGFLLVGGQAGNGMMVGNNGKISGYYQISGASYGMQAGLQTFSYAVFLMDEQSQRRFEKTGGWEIGSSPTVVVGNKGIASSLTTTTINRNTPAFFFNQRGVMAALGLQGSKITRIEPQQ